jgi:formylglycine-generating enzyme required for sulfatase activity
LTTRAPTVATRASASLLPEEPEWAFAAQGSDERRWPCGNATRDVCMPPSYHANGSPAAAVPAVDAFDGQGCTSAGGVEMMVGSVWQWTNELFRMRTWRRRSSRAAVPTSARPHLDPGPKSSPNCATDIWPWSSVYNPTAKTTKVRPIECHAQYDLMDGGYERTSTIGFRCAADNGLKPPQPPPDPPSPSPPSGGSSLVRRQWHLAGAYTWANGAPDKSAAQV